MKKKNIAMMMAGVTVASAVAPVFAAQDDVKVVNLNVKDGKETANGINDLLAVKFEETKGLNKVNESLYEVKIGDTLVIINSPEALAKFEQVNAFESIAKFQNHLS